VDTACHNLHRLHAGYPLVVRDGLTYGAQQHFDTDACRENHNFDAGVL
jgi:hypothetical protein